MKMIQIGLLLMVSSVIPESLLSSELEQLTSGYEREKERVLAPIERKYEDALIALKERLTRAGRLDEALAVSRVLEERRSGGGDWLRVADSKWIWQSGGQLILQRNHRVTHTRWSGGGKWNRVDDSTIHIVDSVGRKFVVKFKDRKSAAVIGPDGSTTLITAIEE